MHRFRVPQECWHLDQNLLILPAPVAHHALTVLRLKPGAVVVCFDGEGQEISGTLISLTPPTVRVEKALHSRPKALRLVLGQGLPKGDKLEQILQHGTELGLDALYPLTLSRAQVRLEPTRVPGKLQRWQRIAEEAARQARRADVPFVHAPVALEAFLHAFQTFGVTQEASSSRHGLLLYEDADVGASIATTLATLGAQTDQARPGLEFWVLIGPEGGFDAGEVRRALEAGFLPVSLGNRILRTETASLAVLAMLSLGEALYRSPH